MSGESGAGKTEANKQLLEYLVWRAGTATAADGLGAPLGQVLIYTRVEYRLGMSRVLWGSAAALKRFSHLACGHRHGR